MLHPSCRWDQGVIHVQDPFREDRVHAFFSRLPVLAKACVEGDRLLPSTEPYNVQRTRNELQWLEGHVKGLPPNGTPINIDCLLTEEDGFLNPTAVEDLTLFLTTKVIYLQITTYTEKRIVT